MHLQCTSSAYIFAIPICTTTIITFQPCALNAKFQHFILKNNVFFCEVGWWVGDHPPEDLAKFGYMLCHSKLKKNIGSIGL